MARRGFLAQAERLATDVRAELNLGAHDRVDPQGVADKYGVPVVPITDLVAEGAKPESVRQLTQVRPSSFSAGTVMVGDSRLIVFNPEHSDGRLANSVAHELAHLLLEHAPGPAIAPGGCRVWDGEKEEEADLLGAALLVHRDAALACARVGLPHEVGAARFGVSPDLMRWRTDGSGASRQAQAEARRRGCTIARLTGSQVGELLGLCDLRYLPELSSAQWRALLVACQSPIINGSPAVLAKLLQSP